MIRRMIYGWRYGLSLFSSFIFQIFLGFVGALFFLNFSLAEAPQSNEISILMEPCLGYGILGTLKNNANRSYTTSGLELGGRAGVLYKKVIFGALEAEFSPFVLVSDDVTQIQERSPWQVLRVGFVGGVHLFPWEGVIIRINGGYSPWSFVYFNSAFDHFTGHSYKFGGGVSFLSFPGFLNVDYSLSLYTSKKLGESSVPLAGVQAFVGHQMTISVSYPLLF